MAVKISDLFSKKTQIPCGEGTLDVKALTLDALTTILLNHRDAVMHLIANSNGGQNIPPIGAVLGEFSDLFAEVIAQAADAVGQEDDIKQLPVMVQIEAVQAIWNLTVPEPKKLLALLSGVTAKLQSFGPKMPVVRAPASNAESNAAADSTSQDTNANSPTPLASSSQPDTDSPTLAATTSDN